MSNGIDVYTTLNIQHIESLNDVVAQITGVRVRETVPDSILDRADAIELVDITPDDLIQRLKEGKVYVPKQAERALEHFFSPANLTALRELALRRTAERVDEQLLDEMQARAISGPWAGRRASARLRERGPARGRARALHQASRRPAARALDGALCRDQAQPAIDRGGARPHRRHAAARPGAWAASRSPFRAAIAASPTTWSPLRKRTTSPRSSSANPRARRGSSCCMARWSRDLLRRCGNISVHVIAGEEIEQGDRSRKRPFAPPTRPEPFDARPYVFALLAVAAAVGVSELLWPWIGLPEHRPRVPHGYRRHRRALRPVAFALRQRRVGALLQFLLHRAVLHVRHRRSEERHCRCVLHHRGDRRFQRRGAGAHARRHGHGPGAHHRVALRLQPQALRRRHARRRALGDAPTRRP